MSCHDMKEGQIWVCGDCGLELKVMKECECDKESCGCGEFTCCGEPLKLKS